MRRSFIELHIAVFLAGITAILGKLITLNEGLLVWWRLLITALTLWIMDFISRKKKAAAIQVTDLALPMVQDQPLPADPEKPPGFRDILRITGIGGIAALHWVCFYGSIKYANVSVALVCLSAIGFFTACIEPLIFRRRHDPVEFLLGLLVIVGIAFIFRFDPHYKTGIIIGLVSALLGSIFPVLNKRLLRRMSASSLTRYELTGGFVCLSILLPFYLHLFPSRTLYPSAADWGWLLILSWVCTVLAFRLSMNALRHVSAFTVNLSYNLEPVYGILLAFVIYREDKLLNTGFYIGFSCVIAAIVLHMTRLWWLRRRSA